MSNQSSLQLAYKTCLKLAHGHYENFPVASWLLPAEVRPHIAAVYAFSRIADDFADEGNRSVEERLLLLNGWGRRLALIENHNEDQVDTVQADHQDAADIFLALGNTIACHKLPVGLFEDLLSAFQQDVTVTRYATWDDLLDYCRRSANPIGRIVLRVCGVNADALDRESDAVCTALQLTNLLQDFGRDWRTGRLYVPTDIQEGCGARVADLEDASFTPAWRAALDCCADKTRELFFAGRPVCDGVTGRLKFELRLTWLGGMRILDRVGMKRYDLLNHRPILGLADALPLVCRAVVWM